MAPLSGGNHLLLHHAEALDLVGQEPTERVREDHVAAAAGDGELPPGLEILELAQGELDEPHLAVDEADPDLTGGQVGREDHEITVGLVDVDVGGVRVQGKPPVK